MSSESVPQMRTFLGRWEESRRCVREWEAANPDLASAWSEALELDEAWVRRRAADRAMPGALRTVGVPSRCAACLAEVANTPALEAARRYHETNLTFLLLLGGVGAGKSVAAAWTVAEVLRPYAEISPRGYGNYFTSQALFVQASEVSRVTSSDFDKEALAAFTRLLKVRWLVIDDLGAERAWNGWMARLDELIDARYGNRRRTVITSNLDSKTFQARYGERISDRIRHDGLVVGVGAKSLRERQAETTVGTVGQYQ